MVTDTALPPYRLSLVLLLAPHSSYRQNYSYPFIEWVVVRLTNSSSEFASGVRLSSS